MQLKRCTPHRSGNGAAFRNVSGGRDRIGGRSGGLKQISSQQSPSEVELKVDELARLVVFIIPDNKVLHHQLSFLNGFVHRVKHDDPLPAVAPEDGSTKVKHRLADDAHSSLEDLVLHPAASLSLPEIAFDALIATRFFLATVSGKEIPPIGHKKRKLRIEIQLRGRIVENTDFEDRESIRRVACLRIDPVCEGEGVGRELSVLRIVGEFKVVELVVGEVLDLNLKRLSIVHDGYAVATDGVACVACKMDELRIRLERVFHAFGRKEDVAVGLIAAARDDQESEYDEETNGVESRILNPFDDGTLQFDEQRSIWPRNEGSVSTIPSAPVRFRFSPCFSSLGARPEALRRRSRVYFR